MRHGYRLTGVFAFVVAAAAGLAAAPSVALSDPRIMEETNTRGIRFPGCELLSTRSVINDLSSRTQILQSELSYLERDSRTMYEEWRGIAGGAASVRGDSASAWRLMTRVSRLIERLKSASGEIQKQEASWWKLRKALQNEAGAEGDVQRTAGGFDVLKNRLRGIVGQVESVDIEIEKLQEEFDFVQREVYAYLSKEFPKAGATPSDPWHRQYEYQRTPRVLLRYDFEEVYARYMREAHESLHTSWDKPKARTKSVSRNKGRGDL